MSSHNIFPTMEKYFFCLNDNSNVYHWCWGDLGSDTDVHGIHRDIYSLRCVVFIVDMATLLCSPLKVAERQSASGDEGGY